MSRRYLLFGPLLAWFLAEMALRLFPGPAYGSSLWRYVSVDFLVFLVLWILSFHILFRSIARGIAGLAELPLPITHQSRLRCALPVAFGLLLLLVFYLRSPTCTVLATGYFGGREMWIWIRKRRAGVPR